MKQFYVYIMTNRTRTLYVGMTNDITRRVWEHKRMLTDGFARQYRIDKLVYYEAVPDATAAILREKQIKGWVRRRKLALIQSMNPEWRDLSLDFLDIRPVVHGTVSARARGVRDSSLSRSAPVPATGGIEPNNYDASPTAQNDRGGCPT